MQMKKPTKAQGRKWLRLFLEGQGFSEIWLSKESGPFCYDAIEDAIRTAIIEREKVKR
jgi:hypothetical protein